MYAMIQRLFQYLLVIVGLLFIGVALFAIRTGPVGTAGGFVQAMETNLKTPLYLFLGFLSILGAYRIGRSRSRKSARKTSSDQKG